LFGSLYFDLSYFFLADRVDFDRRVEGGGERVGGGEGPWDGVLSQVALGPDWDYIFFNIAL